MWASNESAKEVANGTHFAIRIGNLQFDGNSSETPRAKLMVKGLSGVGFDAEGSNIYVGLVHAGPWKTRSLPPRTQGLGKTA